MDIGAYARIDDLSNILASAGVDIPRLRGLRLMATEEKISEEDKEKIEMIFNYLSIMASTK